MHTHDFFDLTVTDSRICDRSDDPIGLLSYRMHKRRRNTLGEMSGFWPALEKGLHSTDVAILKHIESKGKVSNSAKKAINVILGKAISYDSINATNIHDDAPTTMAVKLFMMSMKEDFNVTDISEAISIQQSRDSERVLYGVMSKDEYDKKWKVGKYRPKDPTSRLDPTGVYKNMLKKKNEDVEELDEALTPLQRMRRRMVMRRIAPRLARARALAMKRRGGNDVLKRRARNLARSIMSKKLLGGRNRGDVSVGERARIEKIIAARKGGVERLATRLVTVVRQKQAKRFIHPRVKPRAVKHAKHTPTQTQPTHKQGITHATSSAIASKSLTTH